MNKIILKRTRENAECTFGKLSVLNSEGKEILNCVSLEPKGASSDEANLNLRIMPRSYKLKYSPTSVCLPEVCEKKGILLFSDEVAGFEDRRIFFHIGNFAKDTQGCILLGEQEQDNSILNSQSAIKRFYKLIESLGIDTCELEIKEIGED